MEVHERDVGIDARVLALRLGLDDLNRAAICHGYQNACRCEDCQAREEFWASDRGRRVALPWELDAEAA